jgi:digeranylgeranylglycerophospholipid reductase
VIERNMQRYDAAVIGGGPVGGYVALELASQGYEVALFEEHKSIGEPLKCAGLVTSRVFDIIKIPGENIVQNKVKGAHIHSSSGNTLTIGGDNVHAFVIDRQKFDKAVIKKAENRGAEIFLENKLSSAKRKEIQIELKTSKNREIRCKLLIGADGSYSKTREIFNLPQPDEILKGIGMETKNTNLDPDFVEIFVGKNIAPGFFAWIIPTDKEGTTGRLGLCISQDAPYPPAHYLSNFLKSKQTLPYLKGIKINKKTGGVVPLGPLKKTYLSNILLVGDAAAQVKPTSGGGLYTGLLCARHCAHVATEALNKNKFNSDFLKLYHKLWSADIGRELNIGMKLRRIFKKLSDDQIDKYIKIFQNQEIIDTISKYGDIDYPSKLIKPMLKKTPSLIKLLPKMIN